LMGLPLNGIPISNSKDKANATFETAQGIIKVVKKILGEE